MISIKTNNNNKYKIKAIRNEIRSGHASREEVMIND